MTNANVVFLLIQGYMGKVYRERLCATCYAKKDTNKPILLEIDSIRLMTVRTCEKCERSKT